MARQRSASGGRTEGELAWLASFPESNPNPVIEVDAKGTPTYFNDAAVRHFPNLTKDGTLPIIARAVELVSRHKPAEGTVLLQDVEVGRTIYEQQISIVRRQNQQLIRIYVSDVTEHRRLQRTSERQAKELAESNAELMRRQRVMQSLLEDLQNAKNLIEKQTEALKSANARLEETSLLKDEFVAKASHELRTPLTSIKEGMSLLLDNALGETTPEQHDFIKIMDGDIDRLTELINNMLDLSKIEAGRMRLMRRRMDLGPIIDSLIQSLKPLIGHRVVRRESTELPMVFVDENRIRQVFSNLFSNAVKFTGDDGRIIFRMKREKGFVTVEVEDNGPGIPAEDHDKLFRKFSQVGSVGGQYSRGTGLGLVVCKELTELHGGRVSVTSEVGRGTTFSVCIPIYSEELALGESFRELISTGSPEDRETVALLVAEASTCLDARPRAPGAAQGLEELVSAVRGRVHRGDVVLSMAPNWIVVLAQTNEDGCRAISRRLHDDLEGGRKLRFGAAMYPSHGKDVTTLFERASRTVGEEVTFPERLSGSHEGAGDAREAGNGSGQGGA